MLHNILAIDPGTTQSGVVRYDTLGRVVRHAAIMANETVLSMLRHSHGDGAQLVIEDFENQGRITGQTTRDTIRWSGRFQEAWEAMAPEIRKAAYLTRRAVLVHLCGGMSYRHPDTGSPMKVGDPQVRAALLERYEPSGGGATPEVGTKSRPGPLYGVKSHTWAALALAVTYAETI